jgi:hypothetical protein
MRKKGARFKTWAFKVTGDSAEIAGLVARMPLR